MNSMVVCEYPGRGDTVEVGREEYSIDDGTVELPDWNHVRTLARRHGVHPAVLSHDHCDEPLVSGSREGQPCGRTKVCQFHGERD